MHPLQHILLRCPRCKGAVQTHLDNLKCSQCRQGFPRLGPIWTLFAETDRELAGLAAQADAFARENAATNDKILAQLAGRRLHRRTRARAERVRAALVDHRDRVLQLLESVGVQPAPDGDVQRHTVPGEGKVTAYYHQIHRDWGWDAEGSVENREALRIVDAIRPTGHALGSMVVLGAGASRLAYDLHRTGGADATVAVDINPLPFIVAARVTAGETVDLLEFPLSPRTSDHAVVDRTLRCDAPGAAGFHFLLADGLDPPLPDESVDTVFTPWFIDQIPRDLATVLPTIRRVLKPGGCWLNHGPLLYHPSHTMFVHRYRGDEVMELLPDHGFELVASSWDRMLYMESPAGSQGRTEGVLTFAARRGALPSAEAVDVEPAWLDDPDAVVEALPAFHDYRPPHTMFATILALIDGKRTARAIADVLVRDHGLPREAALGGVQTCLREIYRATR